MTRTALILTFFLTIGAQTVFADPTTNPTNEKLITEPDPSQFRRFWTIEYDGKTSHILGTNHVIRIKESDFPPEVWSALRDSRTVLVEGGSPVSDEKTTDLEALLLPSKTLQSVLTPAAFAELKRLYGLSPALQGMMSFESLIHMKPGAAFFAAITVAVPQVATLIDTLGSRETQGEEKKYLDRWVRDIDKILSDDRLAPMMNIDPKIRKAEVRSIIGLEKSVDTLVTRLAVQNGISVIPLDTTEPYARFGNSHLHEFADLLTGREVSRALADLSRRLQPSWIAARAHSQQTNVIFGQMWLRMRYFGDIETPQFRREIALWADAPFQLPTSGNETLLSGLERIDAFIKSRHFHWLPKIEQEIRKGGAFIAAGLSHVDLDNRSIVQVLKARGYKIQRYDEMRSLRTAVGGASSGGTCEAQFRWQP